MTDSQPSPSLHIHSGPRLIRSVAWNLLGQGVPLVVAIVAIPAIIDGLGTEAFGAFQLGWVVLGYFALLDLGLGRATTKFVAEFAGRGQADRLPHVVVTSAAFQLVVGTIGGFALALLVPTLVDRVFDVPPELAPDAAIAFYLLAVAVPVVLLNTSFSGVLAALQRFDQVNLVQGLTGVATYALPVAVLAVGADLPAVVAVVVLARVLALGAFVLLALRSIGFGRRPAGFDPRLVRSLLSYGGWITVSNLVSPLLVAMDRLVIGALLTLGAVTYYATPYDVIMRLSILPGALVPPLFSAFSALAGAGERDRLSRLFERAARFLALLLVPLAAVVVLVARTGIDVWLGEDFAAHSTAPARILVLAVAVNGMGQLAFAVLQGVGRADLPAKFHLLELPVHAVVLWVLVSRLGIVGAALAWLIRVTLDTSLQYAGALRACRMSARSLVWQVATAPLVPTAGLLAVAGGGVLLSENPAARAASVLVGLVAFGVLAWRYSLSDADRAPLLAVFAGPRAPGTGTSG